MTHTARQIRMARRPLGVPTPDDFEQAEVTLEPLREGEVRFRPTVISLDPYIRLRMAGRHLIGNLSPHDPITSEAVGVVVESRSTAWKPGDTAAGFCAWQDQVVLPAEVLRRVELGGLPPELALGVLGMPGLTAYAGVERLMRPGPGDIVVVSAAAGPVGATVGQLAHARGARVIGIAGGPQKCEWVRRVKGFEACIDYRAGSVSEQLAALCPERPTAYFDNVGGEMLRQMLKDLRHGSRVVVCGFIDDYNSPVEHPGPHPFEIIASRATLMGLVVYDHEDLRPTLIDEVGGLIRAGRFAYREDVAVGLDAAPAAFERLMRGENQGKALVRL